MSNKRRDKDPIKEYKRKEKGNNFNFQMRYIIDTDILQTYVFDIREGQFGLSNIKNNAQN